jgi:hypothetical protein
MMEVRAKCPVDKPRFGGFFLSLLDVEERCRMAHLRVQLSCCPGELKEFMNAREKSC